MFLTLYSLNSQIFKAPMIRIKIDSIMALLFQSGCMDWKIIYFTIDAPPEVSGVSKNRKFFLQIKLLSFCTKIAPKRHKLQKSSKLKKKMSKKPCFLRLFRIFFNLGAILAHQTSTGMFSGSWRIFWHPWDPWGRVNSGDTRVLRFVFDFSACQRHLADFFSLFSNWSQMSPLLIWHV